MKIFLERELGAGFELVEAEHGGQGVGLFEEFVDGGRTVAGLIMDVRMPAMDGIEATRRILAKDLSATICVVTAYAEENLIKEALEAGAMAVINKSLGLPEIAKHVSKAMRDQAGPRLKVEERPEPLVRER